MLNKKVFFKYIRSIFYSLVVTFSIYLFVTEIDNTSFTKNSILFVFAAIFIYWGELGLLAYENRRNFFFLSDVDNKKDSFILFLEVYTIPIFLIFSLSYLGYLNNDSGFEASLILFAATLFTFFRMMDSRLSNRYLDNLKDNIIFDFIKLLTLLSINILLLRVFSEENIFIFSNLIAYIFASYVVNFIFIIKSKFEEKLAVALSLALSIITALAAFLVYRFAESSEIFSAIFLVFINILSYSFLSRYKSNNINQYFVAANIVAIIALLILLGSGVV